MKEKTKIKKISHNPYEPKLAKIEDIRTHTDTVKNYRFKFKDKWFQRRFDFIPGQFIEVSVLGIGESPLTFCSSPFNKEYFEIGVRSVGNVTNALTDLKVGDTIGIRGPFGNGFPVRDFMDNNIVLVAGGIGLMPLVSLIKTITEKRHEFEEILLLYGSKDPIDIIYKKELREWKNIEEFNILTTVDNPTPGWKGNVGVVTKLFDKVDVSPENTIGITCGPPIMMKFVTQSFQKLGFQSDQIFLLLERHMKCGMGICGRCTIGDKFVCKDGPVFTFEELRDSTENIW